MQESIDGRHAGTTLKSPATPAMQPDVKMANED